MDPMLYKYAKSGNVYFLKQILNEDPSILQKLTPQENTPLHIAVQFGHINVVAEIYNRCRSLLSRPNFDGDTPLHVAARTGNFSVITYLVGQILSLTQTETLNENKSILEMLGAKNRENNTVLHEAIRNGHHKVVDFLLELEPKLACLENCNGESPLYLAARAGMTEIVIQILMASPSASYGGSDGLTALHVAVIERHYEIMKVLLRFKKQLVKDVDHYGRTPLYYGAFNGDQKTVRRLLKIDRSIAYVMDKEGQSPIHAAARKGHSNVIKEIIEHCPDAGELIDLFGQNALHAAVIGGQAKVVKYILETKELEGLINQTDIDGNTPLHLAAIERKTWIQCYLMWDARVNRRIKNKSSQTVFEIDKSIKESSIKISSIIKSCLTRNLRLPSYSNTNNNISPGAEKEECSYSTTETYMQMGQTLLVVAALIATVTFSAAFTIPGGFNNNAGPGQGLALLDSNGHLKWFIISDTIAMTCSITAACLLFWGVVIGRESYVYYFITATILTYIALQTTHIAFMTAIEVVLPNEHYVVTVSKIVGIVFHISTFLLLIQLFEMFSILEASQFCISHMICKLKSKIIK